MVTCSHWRSCGSRAWRKGRAFLASSRCFRTKRFAASLLPYTDDTQHADVTIMIWRAIPLLLLASTASGQDEIPATPQNPQAAGGAGGNPMGGFPGGFPGALPRLMLNCPLLACCALSVSSVLRRDGPNAGWRSNARHGRDGPAANGRWHDGRPRREPDGRHGERPESNSTAQAEAGLRLCPGRHIAHPSLPSFTPFVTNALPDHRDARSHG